MVVAPPALVGNGQCPQLPDHVPGGLVGDLERAVQLVGVEAVAGVDEVDGLQPLVQWNRAALEYRPDPDRELLAAGGAFLEAEPCIRQVVILADGAAMRAHRPVRPGDRLDVAYRIPLVGEAALRKNAGIYCPDAGLLRRRRGPCDRRRDIPSKRLVLHGRRLRPDPSLVA